MTKYVYDLSSKSDMRRFNGDLLNIKKMFKDKKFREYIADRCLEELARINSIELGTLGAMPERDLFYEKVEQYKTNNKKEIGDDYILIFNDTTIEQEEMTWLSEESRKNYPNGLSIAYLIEYGTGLVGTSQEDWQTDVHNYGGAGWWYNIDNVSYNTTGISGKFIYKKLFEIVELCFDEWVEEYMEKEIDW